MTDIQIAQSVEMEHINRIAERAGIDTETIDLYGRYKAKLPLTTNGGKEGKLFMSAVEYFK